MPNTVHVNGLSFAYRDEGDPAHVPIVLIMGLGAQLTTWPQELVDALVQRGLRVIRFDNRDIGESSKLHHAPPVNMAWVSVKFLLGIRPRAPYTLDDMAADAAGVITELGLESAHVVGASMGGMVAQLIAAHHSERVRSLTSIMSTTGEPNLRQAEFRLRLDFVRPRAPRQDRESCISSSMAMWRRVGSPEFPAEEAWLRKRVELDFDRCYYPPGVTRHLLAVMAAPGRAEMLRSVRAPTLVIHGRDDPLVPLDGGEDTAASIPGATLKVFEGMGHDLPLELIPAIADLIVQHVRIAEERPLSTEVLAN